LAAFEQALAFAHAHAAKLVVVYAVPRNQPFNTGATERVVYLLNLRTAAEVLVWRSELMFNMETRVRSFCCFFGGGLGAVLSPFAG
jgi:hypothetical protein